MIFRNRRPAELPFIEYHAVHRLKIIHIMYKNKDTSFQNGTCIMYATAKVTCTLKLPNRTEDDLRITSLVLFPRNQNQNMLSHPINFVSRENLCPILWYSNKHWSMYLNWVELFRMNNTTHYSIEVWKCVVGWKWHNFPFGWVSHVSSRQVILKRFN